MSIFRRKKELSLSVRLIINFKDGQVKVWDKTPLGPVLEFDNDWPDAFYDFIEWFNGDSLNNYEMVTDTTCTYIIKSEISLVEIVKVEKFK